MCAYFVSVTFTPAVPLTRDSPCLLPPRPGPPALFCWASCSHSHKWPPCFLSQIRNYFCWGTSRCTDAQKWIRTKRKKGTDLGGIYKLLSSVTVSGSLESYLMSVWWPSLAPLPGTCASLLLSFQFFWKTPLITQMHTFLLSFNVWRILIYLSWRDEVKSIYFSCRGPQLIPSTYVVWLTTACNL